MLTPLTQTAIAMLCSISYNSQAYSLEKESFCREELLVLLPKLELANLIRRKDALADADLLDIGNYELTRPHNQISLLDLLEAIGEHLNCNHPTEEKFYQHYRTAASRLGVVNHMTRLYLSEIKLIDL